MRARWPVVLPAVVAAALALAARWEWAATAQGPRFLPRPDALEYAAGAQAIARSGDYLLQIGPHRVRPRYPPGWPLVLATAVGLGVEGDALWRVTGLFGAALAALLAALAAWTVQRLADDVESSPGTTTGSIPRADLAALAGGLAAGGAWALAPLAVTAGRTVMSDEPAAFVAAGVLAAFAGGLLGRQPRPLLLAAGGLALGGLATMRTVEAALLALPLAILAIGGLRRSGTAALRGLGWAALGAVAAPAAAALVLASSGLPPWRWSGYDLWVPARYARLGDTFRLEYAVAGNPDTPSEGYRMPHLELAARVLAGMPGLRRQSAIGRLWPAVAWVAGALVLARAARGAHGEWRWLPPSPAPERSPEALRRPPTARATSRRRRGGKLSPGWSRAVPWLATALLAWAAAHTVLFALYFFSAPRFHLPVAALCPLALGIAVGLGLAAPRPWMRGTAAAALLLVAASVALDFDRFRREPLPLPPAEPDVRAAFAAWTALPAAARAAGTVPFDPIHAQALGLLGPEAVTEIGDDWGTLPPTRHVRRLRARGMIPR